MRILRDNQDLLLSILEPFLRDPTVSWGRSGRAQRHGSNSESSKSSIKDIENQAAKEMLRKIG